MFHKIKIFKEKFNIKVKDTSRKISIKRRLGSEKDQLKKAEKSGIYIASSSCDELYIVQ